MDQRGAPAGDVARDSDRNDLTRRYHGILLRYFARRGFALHDAQDLAQEVFARLSNRAVLAGVAKPESYLFAVAANVLIDHVRRRKVRADYSAAEAADGAARFDDLTPERVLQGQQELNWVVSALNEMPERMRNIFILARLENLPRSEIAQRLGVSKRLVEQQITLATTCLVEKRKRMI